MEELAKKIYRHMPGAVLTGTDGEPREARGLVTRKGAPGAEGPGLRHPSGVLEDPVYVFTGWAPGAEAGDTLEQAGTRYTVLAAEELALGSRQAAVRLILERQVEDAGT